MSGNAATIACAQADCKNSSLMCDSEDCECKKAHIVCNLFSTLANLKYNFKRKAKSYHPVLTAIYQWY